MFKVINLIAIFFIASIIYCQPNEGDDFSPPERKKPSLEQMAEKVSNHLKDDLNLTDDQYKQVHDIFLNHFTETRSKMESMKDSDRETRKQYMESSIASLNQELEKVLTDDQMVKYKEEMEKRKKRMEERKHKKKSEEQFE